LPAACWEPGRAWGQSEAPPREDATESLKTMRRLAEKTRLSIVAAGRPARPAALRSEPLVRYYDPARGMRDATLWGWGSGDRDGGRLIATLKVEHWTNSPGRRWGIGVSSFAADPHEIEFTDGVVTTLSEPGWKPQPITAPSPAASAVQRLFQMKTMARRFAVSVQSYRYRNPLDLRLLPTPVHRYADAAAGISDGAVFAFSYETNPTVLLALEALREAETGSAWRFGFSRQAVSKISARLDDKEVWTQPAGWGPPQTLIYNNRTFPEKAGER
jgi:hypothetical protein